MDEQERPRLRLIRGGAGSTGSGDHANPHGIPRPGGRVLRKRGGHPSVGRAQEVQPPTGTDGPQIKEPSVDTDPTSPYGIVRPKQFRIIEGEGGEGE